MAKGIESQGIVIAYSAVGSPESYQTINNVTSFKGPGGQANTIDITNLASVAKEKMMGLPDEGTFTLEINYDPDDAVHQAMRTNRVTRLLTMMKITFTDTAPASTAVFGVYVTGFEINGSVDNVVKATITLVVTGAIAWN